MSEFDSNELNRIQPKVADVGGRGPGGSNRVTTGFSGDGKKRITIDRIITVRELAQKLQLKDVEIIKALFMDGVMRTPNMIVEIEHAKVAAQRLGFEVKN